MFAFQWIAKMPNVWMVLVGEAVGEAEVNGQMMRCLYYHLFVRA